MSTGLYLTPKQNAKVIDEALSRLGCWYCWPNPDNNYSGKDLTGAKYPRTYDCSGLYTASLFAALGFDRRSTWNAKSIMDNCELVEGEPKPGDLAFYGPGRNLITHVAIYVGVKHQKGFTLLDSCGGTSLITTPAIAQNAGAVVKLHKNHLYRNDFKSFGRLDITDKVELQKES